MSGAVSERHNGPGGSQPDASFDAADASAVRSSPYKGLTPYTEADAAFFFGRESERRIIAANLMASRLTVLYGPSGVGKSSVLRAGVARDLRKVATRNQAARGVPEFAPLVFGDWREPDLVHALFRAAHTAVSELRGSPPAELDGTDSLADGLEVYADAVGGELFLILDQFEEYFLYHPSEEGFDEQLSRAVARPELRANFLISLREDALAGLDRFKGRMPRLLDNYLRLRHLDRQSARVAIEGPVNQFNVVRAERLAAVTLEPELVDAVLDQVKTGRLSLDEGSHAGVGAPTVTIDDASIETPYLQLVMSRLWEEELGKGHHVLRLQTLERLGGAARIVRTHLDEAMADLSPEEREVAARVFHYLVTPSGTKVAHALPDLAAYASVEPSELRRVVELLSGGSVRILRRVADADGSESGATYEIFHDVLAAPILDWRQRHVAATQRAEAESKRREAEARAHAERRRARLFRGVAVAAIALAVGVGVLAVVVIRANQLNHARELAANATSALPIDPSESVRLAGEALDIRDIPEAELALRQALEESRVRAVMLGHTGWVNDARYSPDGRRVASAGDDGTVRLWDARTGRSLAILRANAGAVDTVAFDRSGRRLLSAGEDDRVRIWDTRSGRVQRTVGGGAGPLAPSLVAFSGDGDLIVTPAKAGGAVILGGRSREPVRVDRRQRLSATALSADGRWVATAGDTAHVWDARTGRSIATKGLPGEATLMEFSPDGRQLLVGANNTVFLWNIGSGQLLRLHHYTEITLASAHFSADGRSIVTAGGRAAHLWDSADGKQIAALVGHQDLVNNAIFAPDGRLVVTVSDDGSARVWDRAGRFLRELRGHSDAVRSAAFSPDSRRVVTASADGTVRVWLVASETVLGPRRGIITSAAFTRNGRHVLTGGEDGSAWLWDRGGRPVRRLVSGAGALTTAELSRDGTRLVTSGLLGGLQIWKIGAGNRATPLMRPLQPGDDAPWDAAFSPNGRWVASVGYRGSVGRIWDARTGRLISLLKGHRGDVLTTAFSPDGRRVVTAGSDKTARIWSAPEGRPLDDPLAGHTGTIWSAAWSHDGGRIVTAGNDGTVRIWEAATGEQLRVLGGFNGAARTAAFSPDDLRVVAGGNDGTTRVWDASTGRPVVVMRRHSDAIEAAAFSPDGRTILTAGDDQTARLYTCETCVSVDRLKELAAARQRYVRRADER